MGWKSCPHIKKLLFMKKFSVFIILICICIGFSGCAIFMPIEEIMCDGYTHTTTYYRTYRPAPSHRHHHYHHWRGHKHRPTAHPHKPHTTHKPSGGHVDKPNDKQTVRPSGSGSRTGGSRTAGSSRTNSGSRR